MDQYGYVTHQINTNIHTKIFFNFFLASCVVISKGKLLENMLEIQNFEPYILYNIRIVSPCIICAIEASFLWLVIMAIILALSVFYVYQYIIFIS